MGRVSLDRVRDQWEIADEPRALKAVLTNDAQWEVDEFLRTGAADVTDLLRVLDEQGLDWRRWRAVLDFGCGPGRLTQALAGHFPEVTGVDVSPSMIRLARRYAAGTGSACTFMVNERPDLSVFTDRSFDLVFSTLVLQHIPSDLTRSYLGEFVRVLRPGGAVVFQLPSGNARTLKGLVLRVAPLTLVRLVRTADMYAMPVARVRAILAEAGAEVIDVVDDHRAGPNWVSHTYVARRGEETT